MSSFQRLVDLASSLGAASGLSSIERDDPRLRELAALATALSAPLTVGAPDGWRIVREANGDLTLEKEGIAPYVRQRFHSRHMLHAFLSAILARELQQPSPAASDGEAVGILLGYGAISGEARVQLAPGLPTGTKLYTAPQPAPAAQTARAPSE